MSMSDLSDPEVTVGRTAARICGLQVYRLTMASRRSTALMLSWGWSKVYLPTIVTTD